MMIRAMAMAAMLVVIGGCATVNLDYNPAVRFDSDRSFALVAPEQPGWRTLDGQRIEAALDQGLRAKGLQPAAADAADILVHYRVEPQLRNESSGFSYGFGWGRGPAGVAVMTSPEGYVVKEGKLVVEMVRSQDQDAVWRAASRRYLNEDMTPQRRETLIRSLVADMLKQWPPQ